MRGRINLCMTKNLDSLFGKIMMKIRAEEKIKAKRQIFGISLFLAILVAIIPQLISFLIEDMASSSAFHYLQLLVTDTQTVATYWQDFIMATLESAPIFSLGIMFAAMLGILWSIGRLAKSINILKLSKI